ncbi:response regulator [Herbaspirillum sp. NPDC087042]|uniref:response regulator n=1 Tax=Herbaspirillum sp. NPDC087042 TaxID=3364004 RepID=UPI00380D3426
MALVEDDTHVQIAFQHALAQAADMHLLSVSGTLAQARLALAAAAPDVLLVDIGLPDGCGIELIRLVHAQYPQCNIMVCTTFGDEDHVMQSIEAGASGYLLKDSAAANIVTEIRNLQAGGSPISPLIARQVLLRFRGNAARNQAAVPAVQAVAESARQEAPAGLSARETEVLEFITRGFTAEEIAGLMGITRNTVLTFIRRIYAKLEVHSKTEAIFEARSRGWIRT